MDPITLRQNSTAVYGKSPYNNYLESPLGNPEDTSQREYNVTMKNHSDCEQFYNDMETLGGTSNIPDRECHCCRRRSISRNTVYKLTYAEAEKLLADERVAAVELTPEEQGLKPVPLAWQDTSTHFDKKTESNSQDIQWGLVRQLVKTNPTGWGVGADLDLERTVTSQYSGKNVDVVVMDDGCPFPSTFEYAQNADGTGFSRLVQYNWYKHIPELTPTKSAAVYDYSFNATGNSPRTQEHGAHCMGTTAGNTQGWARDANIYFISFYDDTYGSQADLHDASPMDFVRAWHNSKPINPKTGVKNPTIINNSWGYNATTFDTSKVSSITYRGNTYSPTSGSGPAGTAVWDNTLLDNFWCTISTSRNAAADADFEDMINDGIIVVASAGNDNSYMDVVGGPDYNNSFVMWSSSTTSNTYYPHRGASPGAATGVINVGAAGAHNEASGASIYDATGVEQQDYRAEFSNFGPRCDIWGAGSAIQSIWNSGDDLYDNIPSPDPRCAALNLNTTNHQYINNFKKCPGTSMSGPNVCGVLACILEAFPRATQTEIRNYLSTYCDSQMQWTLGGRDDDTDLGYSKSTDVGTRYIFLEQSRISSGVTASGDGPEMRSLTFPPQNGVNRLSSGVTFPRVAKVYNRTSEPTYALSVNNTNIIANGTNSTTFTLTTTNVPDGTKIPYIITSKYRGGGKTTIVDSGVYGIYDATNTNVLVLTGTQLGDSGGEEKSHIIDMSVAGTTPTIQLNPNGNTAWTRAVHPETYVTGNAVPAAKTITLDVTASSSTAYQFTGTDRRTVHNGTENDPIIVVNYGDTIEFNINSGASHPFYLRNDTSGQNTDNIATGISSGSNGATSGTITIDTTNLTIPGSTNLFGADTGAWFYYQCGSHSGMKGIIFVQPTAPLGTEHYMNYLSYTLATKVDDLFSGGSTDDGQFIIPIGFNIDIFGNQQDKIYLQCNQFITFGGTVSGSTWLTSSQTAYARDKILLGGGDRSLPYFELWWGGDPDLGTSYLFMDFRYPTNRYSAYGYGQSDYQLMVKQAEPDKIYLNVTRNDLREVKQDMYPFYQDKILGGVEPTGEVVVNNNQATLTITPSANFTNPDNETEVDVNMRLNFFGTPDVSFSVSEAP
jgi:hypothetical protein